MNAHREITLSLFLRWTWPVLKYLSSCVVSTHQSPSMHCVRPRGYVKVDASRLDEEDSEYEEEEEEEETEESC